MFGWEKEREKTRDNVSQVKFNKFMSNAKQLLPGNGYKSGDKYLRTSSDVEGLIPLFAQWKIPWYFMAMYLDAYLERLHSSNKDLADFVKIANWAINKLERTKSGTHFLSFQIHWNWNIDSLVTRFVILLLLLLPSWPTTFPFCHFTRSAFTVDTRECGTHILHSFQHT